MRSMFGRIFTIALVLVLLGAATIWNSSAGAQTTRTASGTPVAADLPAFAIYPKESGPGTYFDVKQDAGTTANYTVVLANFGAKNSSDFKGRIYVANVHIRTNGGLDSGQPSESRKVPAIWFAYDTKIVALQPGRGVEDTFAVTVPKDTQPGQYVAALAFETADPLEIPGTPNLKQKIRQTIAFVITVPGPVHPSFKITELHLVSDPEWSGLEANLVNTGNVLVKPAGTLTISALDGTPLLSQDVALGSYYAFQQGLIQLGFAKSLAAGDYLVTLDLHDATSGATAVVENQKFTTVTQGQLIEQAAPPVKFSNASGELKPSAVNPQFLNVSATINNSGDPVQGAELSILAYKDGKLVETYVLVSPLALPKGDTTVNSRYIPADGFSKGTWNFKLSVQVRDPKSGVATVLNTVDLGQPVTIP